MTFDFVDLFMKFIFIFQLLMQTYGHRFVHLVLENGKLQGSINPRFAFMQIQQQQIDNSISQLVIETSTENPVTNESGTTSVTVIKSTFVIAKALFIP